MAYPLPADALTALTNSHAGSRWVVTARYGGVQTIPNADYESVPITTDGQFSFNSSGGVQASGSLFVASDGASLAPKSMGDPLAPFGQELQIDYEVAQGGQSWRVPMGVYRIGAVPSWEETVRVYPAMRVTTGWAVEVDFSDRFDRISAAQFLGPTSPTKTTALAEAAYLAAGAGVATLWPAGLADAAIPSGLTYESDRLDAIAQLLAAANCDPAMNRQGMLTAVPRDRWIGAREVDADIRMDGVVSFTAGMSGDVYNTVVFSSSQTGLTPAIAQITDDANPLSVGRLGLRVYTESSDLMDTQQKLVAAAQTTLRRLSQRQAQQIRVVGLPRPDVDLGDLVFAHDPLSGRKAVGQLVSFDTGGFDPTSEWTYDLTGVELL